MYIHTCVLLLHVSFLYLGCLFLKKEIHVYCRARLMRAMDLVSIAGSWAVASRHRRAAHWTAGGDRGVWAKPVRSEQAQLDFWIFISGLGFKVWALGFRV